MKAIIGVLILVIVIGGAYYFTTNTTEAPSGDVMENKDGDAMMEGDSMGMPAPGHDGDEMMVDDGAMMEKGERKVFDVSGRNFTFSMEEIKVKKGDTVVINFVSSSGFHDWVVDEFEASTKQVRPEDGTTSVEFVADKTGTFEYYCSVGSHRAQGMVGNLIVE